MNKQTTPEPSGEERESAAPARAQIHQEMILRRWHLISKMDASTALPSPCVSVCLTNEENICTGCFRSIDEISNWASFTPKRQLEVWKNLLERIEQLTAPPQAGVQ